MDGLKGPLGEDTVPSHQHGHHCPDLGLDQDQGCVNLVL